MDFNDVDLKFWISFFFLVALSLSVLNDFSTEKICGPVEGGSVCFNEWGVLGYDTGLPIGFRVFGNVSMEGFELTRYVFVRGSNFSKGKKWFNGSNSGKFNEYVVENSR